MKNFIPALLLILAASPAHAHLSDEDYSDRLSDLDGFARYDHSVSVGNEGRRCLPNWDEKYAAAVKENQATMSDAARKALEAGDSELSYRRGNQPYIGAFSYKTTAYMCERGYESLLGEYDGNVKRYEEIVTKLEDQADRLTKLATEADRLFEKKALQKDLAAGKCIFTTRMKLAAAEHVGGIRKEAREINELVEYFRENTVGERGDRKTTAQERDETCDGKKVRTGALKAKGEWGNDREPEVPAGHASAQ